MKKERAIIYLIFIILFHLSFWFFISSKLTIHPDEADHWVWSQHLSWGYYEHPPMIAFIIRFFTTIFGDTWFAIELCSQSLSILTMIFLFLFSKELFGWGAALVSIIALESMPLFFIGSTILTIDNILIVFWVMVSYFFSKGISEGRGIFLLLSGVAFGLGLLSKYTMILLPASIFLYLIFSSQHRDFLRRKEPYISFMIGLIIFSPVILWNAQHDWLSFSYQISKGLTGGKHGGQLPFFLVSQFVILGPTLFPFFIYSIYRGFKSSELKSNSAIHNPQSTILYLTVLAAFPFLFFAAASFRAKYTDVGWSDVALITGAVLIGKAITDMCKNGKPKRNIIIYSVFFIPGFLISLFLVMQSVKPFSFVPKSFDRSVEMYGWDKAGTRLEEVFNNHFPDEKKRFIISKEYQMAGALSFYAPSHPVPYTFNKSVRNIWVKTEDFGKGATLMVCLEKECNESVEQTEGLFSVVKEVDRLEIKKKDEVVRSIKIYICSGLKTNK